MPNRIIKESICISDDIDVLSPQDEAFFYRILVNCDDYGRMDARSKIVRAKCYPLRVDRVSLEDIDRMLMILSHNLITLYEVGEKIYLQVNTWEKHQNIRAKDSKYPSIYEGKIIKLEIDYTCNHMNTDEIICNQMQVNVPVTRYSYLETRNSILDNMPAPDGTGESENAPAESPADEVGGAQDEDSGKGKDDKNEYTEDFKEFWSYYPRKTEKLSAFGKWKARLKQKVPREDLIKAAKNYAEKCKLEGTEERFIKHAKTFLGENKPYEEFINWVPSKNSASTGNATNTLKKLYEKYEREECGSE